MLKNSEKQNVNFFYDFTKNPTEKEPRNLNLEAEVKT